MAATHRLASADLLGGCCESQPLFISAKRYASAATASLDEPTTTWTSTPARAEDRFSPSAGLRGDAAARQRSGGPRRGRTHSRGAGEGATLGQTRVLGRVGATTRGVSRGPAARITRAAPHQYKPLVRRLTTVQPRRPGVPKPRPVAPAAPPRRNARGGHRRSVPAWRRA